MCLAAFPWIAPSVLVVRAFSIFVVFFAWSVVFCMCFKKMCLGSTVRLSSFTVLFVGSVMLFIGSLSFVECSDGCGANGSVCVLRGLKRFILFFLVKYVLQV